MPSVPLSRWHHWCHRGVGAVPTVGAIAAVGVIRPIPPVAYTRPDRLRPMSRLSTQQQYCRGGRLSNPAITSQRRIQYKYIKNREPGCGHLDCGRWDASWCDELQLSATRPQATRGSPEVPSRSIGSPASPSGPIRLLRAFTARTCGSSSHLRRQHRLMPASLPGAVELPSYSSASVRAACPGRHRQSVKNAMISIASQPRSVMSVEISRQRASGSSRSDSSCAPATPPVLDGDDGGKPAKPDRFLTDHR